MVKILTDFDLGGVSRVRDLADPVNPEDAANKEYADAGSVDLVLMSPVAAATVSVITLHGEQTVDGVSVLQGMRVLAKNQADSSQNGIYIASSGDWARSSDANTSGKVATGMYVPVTSGTQNGNTGWVLSTTGDLSLGTTALTFSLYSEGKMSIMAGPGLQRLGSQFSVLVDGTTVTINESGELVASGGGSGGSSTRSFYSSEFYSI